MVDDDEGDDDDDDKMKDEQIMKTVKSSQLL